jgi:hypothetical protein
MGDIVGLIGAPNSRSLTLFLSTLERRGDVKDCSKSMRSRARLPVYRTARNFGTYPADSSFYCFIRHRHHHQ